MRVLSISILIAMTAILKSGHAADYYIEVRHIGPSDRMIPSLVITSSIRTASQFHGNPFRFPVLVDGFEFFEIRNFLLTYPSGKPPSARSSMAFGDIQIYDYSPLRKHPFSNIYIDRRQAVHVLNKIKSLLKQSTDARSGKSHIQEVISILEGKQ